jgi:hypothetical protein
VQHFPHSVQVNDLSVTRSVYMSDAGAAPWEAAALGLGGLRGGGARMECSRGGADPQGRPVQLGIPSIKPCMPK